MHASPGGEGGKKMSKKQRKMLSRLKIAELKQLCERPDVVEVWDVTSPDPQLLVFLKASMDSTSMDLIVIKIETTKQHLPSFSVSVGLSQYCISPQTLVTEAQVPSGQARH